MENEEFDSEGLTEILKEIDNLPPDSLAYYLLRFPSIDYRLGGLISECFEEGERLSNDTTDEWSLARVVSGNYVMPNVNRIAFYCSKFSISDQSEDKYPINRVELYGSELSAKAPPSITSIMLRKNSKVNIDLTKRGKYGIFLNNMFVDGSNCSVWMRAGIEDTTTSETFTIRFGGRDNTVEMDLRKLSLKLVKLYFHEAGPNNYVHLKLNENAEVRVGYWYSDVEGVKIIIEGGKNLNVDDLVNNNVDYEVI